MEFSQIAILLSVAALAGIVSKQLKQPLLVGYLFTGLILGLLGIVKEGELLEALGKIGVTLLLFLLGLEMNLKELPKFGRTSLITGVGQILFTTTIGFLLALLLGFALLPALYIGIALAFSSTIIIVKLLSEKKEFGSLYGRISVGFLLVQDFVAMLILILLSSLGGGDLGIIEYILVAVKATSLFVLVWALSKYAIPYYFNKLVATSSELLFVVSIAWALGVATLVAGPIGFTLEIGGFIAGLALSNLPEHLQIAARTRPLRDFFLVIFFLYLGTQLVVGQGILPLLPIAFIFSLFVLVGNPLIVLTIMGFLGYKKRTSFMAGLTVAQISEFSFIVLAMGASLGHVGQREVATVILVGVFTMTISTYLILGAEKLYKKLEKYLSIFERKFTKEGVMEKEYDLKDHVVLIGAHRTGRGILAFLIKKKYPFIIVDFDPAIISHLAVNKIPVIFGDVNDPEIIEDAQIEKARAIISTVPNIESNLMLLEYIKNMKVHPLCIFTAATRTDALILYGKGATYVVVPEVAAGEFLKHVFDTHGIGKSTFESLGKRHFNRLMYK